MAIFSDSLHRENMKEQIQHGRERAYDLIYSEGERLSLEVEQTPLPSGFDKYLLRLNQLQRKYISEFKKMNHTEKEDVSLLLNMLQNQIHGRIDVFRAHAMKGELRPRE
jgi:hypothetical protein